MSTSNKKLLFILPILLVFAALGYYFLYWVKTPAYAVNAVREAVQQHDVVKFEKHVNINSVLNKAFDDFITAESKINNDSIAENPFAIGILHMLKPSVVNLLEEEVKDYIANDDDNAGNNKRKDPVSDAMRKNMENKVQLDKLTIKDIKLINSDKGIANLILALYNKSLDKDFNLQLKMQINQNDDWQIVEITNLIDFIVDIHNAQQAKLSERKKPIQEQLNNALLTKDKKLSIQSEQTQHSQRLILSAVITVVNNTAKTIEYISYDLEIFDKNNNVIYSYPERFKGNIPSGQQQIFSNSKQLNLLLPADKLVADLNLNNVNWKIQPTYIRFTDDTVLSSEQY